MTAKACIPLIVAALAMAMAAGMPAMAKDPAAKSGTGKSGSGKPTEQELLAGPPELDTGPLPILVEGVGADRYRMVRVILDLETSPDVMVACRLMPRFIDKVIVATYAEPASLAKDQTLNAKALEKRLLVLAREVIGDKRVKGVRAAEWTGMESLERLAKMCA